MFIFLVGALEHGFYFSIYWEFIIPTDELIFFRWVIPPTSYGSCFFFKPDNGWSNSYLRVTSYHCQPCLFISTHGVRKDPKQIFKMVFQSFLSFSLWFSRWVFPFRGDAHGPLSLPQFWRCCLSSRSGTGVKGEDVMWFSDLLEDFGYFGWFWIIENGDSALLNHPNLAND